jgi:hypothetical protein
MDVPTIRDSRPTSAMSPSGSPPVLGRMFGSGVLVAVGCGVALGIRVGELVADGRGVLVAVDVGVAVGTFVEVAVAVAVAVWVGVAV